MSDPAIASLIREVLAEELARLGNRTPRGKTAVSESGGEEHVAIATDKDLASFVDKIMAYAADPDMRRRIEQGRLVFRLAGARADAPSTAAPQPDTAQVQSQVVTVASGFFSERQVDRLPKGTKSVRLGKAVRMTPLARDRLRHRGISIERTEQ